MNDNNEYVILCIAFTIVALLMMFVFFPWMNTWLGPTMTRWMLPEENATIAPVFRLPDGWRLLK